MTDLFELLPSGLISPAGSIVAVTPNDSSDLDYITRGLYIGGAGDVAVEGLISGTVTFVGVPAGSILPIRVKKVLETGTTATSIVALW